MTTVHYERIIESALRSISRGPWSDEDLTLARGAITDDLCRTQGPGCTGAVVTAWFDSLGAEQKEDLLFQVNSRWNDDLGPWALG